MEAVILAIIVFLIVIIVYLSNSRKESFTAVEDCTGTGQCSNGKTCVSMKSDPSNTLNEFAICI